VCECGGADSEFLTNIEGKRGRRAERRKKQDRRRIAYRIGKGSRLEQIDDASLGCKGLSSGASLAQLDDVARLRQQLDGARPQEAGGSDNARLITHLGIVGVEVGPADYRVCNEVSRCNHV